MSWEEKWNRKVQLLKEQQKFGRTRMEDVWDELEPTSVFTYL